MANNCLGFLVTTFVLFATATCFYDEERKLYVDERYNRTVKAVVDILWKNFETDIQLGSNVLLFAMPSAIEIDFMTQVLDKEIKEKAMQSLALYADFRIDLRVADFLTENDEMQLTTIFVGNFEEMNERKIIGHAIRKLSKYSNRFQLIVNNKTDYLPMRWNRLLSKIMESGIAATCGVRYCAYPTILTENAPFAILTLASWNITSVEGFTLNEHVLFALSETSSTGLVPAVRSVAYWDYAEFLYTKPNDCIGKVIRLPYKKNFHLVFAISSAKKMCRSAEDLWKNVQHRNFGGMTYFRKPVDVSIPRFKVSANIELRKKLKGTVLADAFDQPSSTLYNALAFQAVEVIFNPQVSNKTLTAVIPQDNLSIFKVERPFFFALYHKISPTPIFAGLINNPVCNSVCQKRVLVA